MYLEQSGGSNPYEAAGAGVGVGVAGTLAVQKVRQANSRASWALGIGVALTALSFVSSSDLNACQSTALSLTQQAQAITLDDTSAATLAVGVRAIQNVAIGLGSNQQQLAYAANWWSFSGAPPVATQAPAGVSSTAHIYAAATQATTANSSNSTAIVVIGVAILALVALVAFN